MSPGRALWRAALLAVSVVGAVAAAACSGNLDLIPDNALPRDIELSGAAIPLAGLSIDRTAVTPPLLIDTGTDLTALSQGVTELEPGRTTVERMGLLSGAPLAERLAFRDLQVVVTDLQPIGQLGRLALSGVLGSDVLSQFLVTFDYGADRITFDDRRINDVETLEGSVGMTLTGGGFVSIESGPEPERFERLPSLVVTPGCLDFAADPVSGEPRGGTDASVLVATGQARTVVAASAARRLGLELGEETQLFTPGGAYPARTARLGSVALVSDVDLQRSPCDEMALARRFIRGPRGSAVEALETASLLWLTEPREVLVIEDEVAGQTAGPFDALRTQTRPRVPVVDVLGSDYLSWTRTTIDYQDRRLVFQCRTDRDCPTCEVAPCIRQAHCNTSRLPELPPLPGPQDDGVTGGDGGPQQPTTPRFDVRRCVPFP